MKERLVKERWMVKNRSADFASICTKFGVSGVAARLMVNRGLTEEGEIEAYLHPSLSSLHPAVLLKDAEKAADILAARLAERKNPHYRGLRCGRSYSRLYFADCTERMQPGGGG